MLYEALKAHQVAAEYLELPSGGHGLNGYKGPMWDAWQTKSLEWLAAQKLPSVLVSDAANQLVEIPGHFRGKSQPLAAEGVPEGDRPGVKCETGVGLLRAAILPVAHDGMSDTGEMHPDLVLPARQQVHFQQGKFLRLFEHSDRPYGTAFPWQGRT